MSQPNKEPELMDIENIDFNPKKPKEKQNEYFSFMVYSGDEKCAFNHVLLEDIVSRNEVPSYSVVSLSKAKHQKLEAYIEYDKADKELSKKDSENKESLETRRLDLITEMYKIYIAHVIGGTKDELEKARIAQDEEYKVEYEEEMKKYKLEKERLMQRRKREKARMRTLSRLSGRKSGKSSARSNTSTASTDIDLEEPVLKVAKKVVPLYYIYLYFGDYPTNGKELESLIKGGVNVDAIFSLKGKRVMGPPIRNFAPSIKTKPEKSGRKKKSAKASSKKKSQPLENLNKVEGTYKYIVGLIMNNLKSDARKVLVIEEEFRDYFYSGELNEPLKIEDVRNENFRFLNTIENNINYLHKEKGKVLELLHPVTVNEEVLKDFNDKMKVVPVKFASVGMVHKCLIEMILKKQQEEIEAKIIKKTYNELIEEYVDNAFSHLFEINKKQVDPIIEEYVKEKEKKEEVLEEKENP